MIVKKNYWFHPALHLLGSGLLSMLTGIITFGSMELDRQTQITFVSFYVILGLMALLFIYRNKLTNSKTSQLLQFSFILLGFVLMVTGALGVFSGSLKMAIVLLLMLFLPGLVTLRAGLYFKKGRA